MPLLSTTRGAAPATGLGPLALTLALALVLAAALGAPAPAQEVPQEVPESVDYCMACHSDETLELPFEDGDVMSLYVELEGFLQSMHGAELVCTDCHEGYDSDEQHPSGATFAGRRQYVLSHGDACKQCHFDTYTRTLESIHHEYREEGFDMVPVCTDCHGAHAVANPHEKGAMISRSCATCHDDVYRTYAGSVHGRALVEEGLEDVPSCADCHTAHSIEAASTVAFRLHSPEICVDCHGDPERMAAHGLSTWVATSYLSDFHGVTAALADPDTVDERQLVVTCVDCHGVHDIRSPEAVGREAMVARVQDTCQGCHEGAAQDFPAAWLSHYEPSLRHAPLVWAVELFYKIFIPFVTLGLALQVGLHLIRATARR
jgi:Zn-finger protein